MSGQCGPPRSLLEDSDDDSTVMGDSSMKLSTGNVVDDSANANDGDTRNSGSKSGEVDNGSPKGGDTDEVGSKGSAADDEEGNGANGDGSIASFSSSDSGRPVKPKPSSAEVKAAIQSLAKYKKRKGNNTFKGADGQKKLKALVLQSPVTPAPKPQADQIPFGWSFRHHQQRGTKPKCRGCGKAILHIDPRIRHAFKQVGDKYNTRHQCHCRTLCLEDLTAAEKLEIRAKKWS